MKGRLLVLTLGAFAIGTDGFMVAGISSEIVTDLQVSYPDVGFLVTVFAFTVAVVAPLLAVITAHMDQKRVLVVLMTVFAMGNLLSAVAPGYGWLVFSRVISAMGAALYTPVATTVATRVVSKSHQGRAISLVSSGLTIAITMGVPLGTWLGDLFLRTSNGKTGFKKTHPAICRVCY